MNVGEATWDAGFLDGGIGSLSPRSHNLPRFKPLSTEERKYDFFTFEEKWKYKMDFSYFLEDLNLFHSGK